MKNRKHQGILSIALAFAIFLGAAVGAMTGIPLAGAERVSPRFIFSRESWEASYAKYEIYGLSYDEVNGAITYHGQVVRYFEDMWPIGDGGKAGASFTYEGGTIDVYSVREYPEFIQRNPDGSYDPSGILVGLREATQEEYDALTARLRDGHNVNQTIVMEAVPGTDAGLTYGTKFTYASSTLDPLATAVPMIDATPSPMPAVVAGGAFSVGEIEWWTAEEYRAWMEMERIALQELVDEQARAWTSGTGWFIWTQEKADEAMARYESVLHEIERGVFVSKTINGEDANMELMQDVPSDVFSTLAPDVITYVVGDYPSSDAASGDVVAEENGVLTWHDSNASRLGEADLGSHEEGTVIHVATSSDGKWGYTAQEWAEIQDLIDLGLIQVDSHVTLTTLEPNATAVPQVQATPMTVVTDAHYVTSATLEPYATVVPKVQATPMTMAADVPYHSAADDWIWRLAEWEETIALYAPFGLSIEPDTALDMIRLYWNGQEIRGIFDAQRGVWITEHSGNGYYPEGAKDLMAVYENGVLIGLRESDAEESALWDRMREMNTQR